MCIQFDVGLKYLLLLHTRKSPASKSLQAIFVVYDSYDECLYQLSSPMAKYAFLPVG